MTTTKSLHIDDADDLLEGRGENARLCQCGGLCEQCAAPPPVRLTEKHAKGATCNSTVVRDACSKRGTP